MPHADFELVHAPPDGQALVYERPGRYTAALEGLWGERFLSYRRAWKARGEGAPPGDFPLSLDFSANSGCQLSCLMCPLPGRARRRRKSLMPLPLVKRLLDEGREHALPAITLGLGSEPLLSPDLPAILSLCGKSGAMDIRLGTNGLLLGGAVSDSLLDSPLTRLEISVDAASPASYQAIRGGDYLSLLKNIDMFLEKREKLGRAFPLLRLSFLALSENRGELDAFLALWGERADMLSVQKPIWFPESRLPKPERPEPPPLAPCRQPWQRLSVLEDGSVWPCCSWYGEKLISKSAFNESVEDIWRGSEMRILRERLSDGAPPGPCQDCRAAGAF